MEDYRNCPVGIKNTSEIQHTQDKLDMAIQRFEEKLDDMKEDIASLSRNMDQKFKAVDQKFDAIDKRLDKLEESLPKKIDERIKTTGSTKIAGWIIGLTSAVITAVVVGFVKFKLGI